MFCTKDFIETADGLMFAVVADGMENGKVLCFLRYVQQPTGWQKVATAEANALLKTQYPDYLHYSPILDAHLHALSQNQILRHYHPKARLQDILQNPEGDIEQDLQALCGLFLAHGVDLAQMGVTGSILLKLQKPSSDIDLVCYDRAVFQQCRAMTAKLIATGQLQSLHELDWQTSYQRRGCALSYLDYVWHEQRKFNKALINGRKFDLSFINPPTLTPSTHYQKEGYIKVRCRVLDDSLSFDYPAEYQLDHKHFQTVVCFTATYFGQAMKGELVEISALIEADECGFKRLVVGSSREADNEYIRVIRA